MIKLYFLFFLVLAGCVTHEKRTYVTRHVYERPQQNCYPHVSGDVFRHFADHIVDDTRVPFDAKSVKEGDVIFLKTKYLRQFLKYMHPKIPERYILITGNGDEDVPGNFAHLLEDKKLIRWFAMNTTIEHPKLIPIPIGGGSLSQSGKEAYIRELMLNPAEKETLLYINFKPDNHPERARALNYFADKSFCSIDKPCSSQEFLERVSRAKYVLCPQGNGLDTHRVWETLLLGSIPILKHNELDPLYSDLPILFVNDWSEVSEELLQRRYAELKNGSYNFEKLMADYWLKLINPEKWNVEKLKARSYLDSVLPKHSA